MVIRVTVSTILIIIKFPSTGYLKKSLLEKKLVQTLETYSFEQCDHICQANSTLRVGFE